VFGKITPINKNRGRLIDLDDGIKALVTVHPSYLLRLPALERRALLFRHGRACPGHPRLSCLKAQQDVDARHKAGHDEHSLNAQFYWLPFESDSRDDGDGLSVSST
jgi:hypothetical protein